MDDNEITNYLYAKSLEIEPRPPAKQMPKIVSILERVQWNDWTILNIEVKRIRDITVSQYCDI